LKISNFRENSAKILQMLQNLQNIAKFQNFQLDNLVDFEKCCKTHIYLQKIGADTAENEQHFAEILPIGRRVADRCRAYRAVLPGVLRLPGRPLQRRGDHQAPRPRGPSRGFPFPLVISG
jgi:hypothetical protein